MFHFARLYCACTHTYEFCTGTHIWTRSWASVVRRLECWVCSLRWNESKILKKCFFAVKGCLTTVHVSCAAKSMECQYSCHVLWWKQDPVCFMPHAADCRVWKSTGISHQTSAWLMPLFKTEQPAPDYTMHTVQYVLYLWHFGRVTEMVSSLKIKKICKKKNKTFSQGDNLKLGTQIHCRVCCTAVPFPDWFLRVTWHPAMSLFYFSALYLWHYLNEPRWGS